MPKFRRLTESEAAIAQRWLQGLKSELDRVDPSPPSYTPTTDNYLKSLAWVQYEGITLDPKKVTQFPISPALLLIAEHLQTTFGFTLLLSDDLSCPAT